MNTIRKLLQPSKTAGFTLVELLVTTAITSIILLTASTILMTFFLSNTRTSIRRQLKSEGARASARIEFIARGAQGCTPVNGATTEITFTNLDSSTVRFWTQDIGGVRNISMTTTPPPGGGSATTENLLSTFARVQNFSFACVKESDTANNLYANIRFELVNPGTNAVVESFSTLAVLRNSE